MEKKESTFHSTVSPILVLVIICFVVTFLVSYVYGITKPIIDRNTAKTANEARTDLLPSAKGEFKEYKGKLVVLEPEAVYVDNCYTATNKSGMVVTVMSKSYGGLLTAMVGIDKDGAVTKVKITNHSDTPGVGTRADDSPSHLAQYKGLKKLDSENVKQDTQVKYVSGASVSSGAIHKAVWTALEQYNKMGGVK